MIECEDKKIARLPLIVVQWKLVLFVFHQARGTSSAPAVMVTNKNVSEGEHLIAGALHGLHTQSTEPHTTENGEIKEHNDNTSLEWHCPFIVH